MHEYFISFNTPGSATQKTVCFPLMACAWRSPIVTPDGEHDATFVLKCVERETSTEREFAPHL